MSDQESMEAASTEANSTNVLRFVQGPAVKRTPLATDPFTAEERKELRELMEYMRVERPIYEMAKTRCTILARLTQG